MGRPVRAGLAVPSRAAPGDVRSDRPVTRSGGANTRSGSTVASPSARMHPIAERSGRDGKPKSDTDTDTDANAEAEADEATLN